MITITLRSYTVLPHPPSDFRLGRPFEMDIEEGTVLSHLIQAVLAIPAGDVALAAVNGQRSPESAVLQPRDRVDLYPPIGGG